MRLSADPDHADYKCEAIPATVCLDGRIVDMVLHADEEAGQVTVVRMDDKGHVAIANGEVLTDVLHGHVRIYIKASPGPVAVR